MRSRRLEIRNSRIIISTIAVVTIFTIIGSVLFGTVKAHAASAEAPYKYYTSIRVEKGDTLWNIADTYITDNYDNRNDYIEEICSINHIAENTIHTGQYLTIPYYSSDYLE